MEKYLTSLLELNNRVIVPDLGAFIIRQQDPKELVFNDLLSFDDGMLTEQLIREEKLSKAEARKQIQKFVEKVKTVLQKGEEYHLENLGALTMDASSRINFLTSDSDKPSEEGAGKQAVQPDTGEEDAEEAGEEKAAGEESEGLSTEEASAGSDEDAAVSDEAAEGRETEKNTEKETTDELLEESPAESEQDTGIDEEPEPGQKAEKEVVEEPESVRKVEEEVVEELDSGEEPVEDVEAEPAADLAAVEQTAESKQDTGVDVESGKAEDAGFELQGEDAAVEIDAASEDSVSKEARPETRAEEPPFQIDEQEAPEGSAPEMAAGEEPAGEPEAEIPSEFRKALAEEPAGDESVSIEEFLEKEQEQQRVKVEGVPVNLEPDNVPFSTYTQPVRRRRAWPWILGSLLLIIVILAAGRFFFPGTVTRFLPERMSQWITGGEPGSMQEPAAQAGEITETGPEKGSASPETGEQAGSSGEMAGSSQVSEEAAGNAGTAENDESAAGETVATPTTAGKKYYVVAGCFADIRNAENYVRTLRAEGYDASVFGTRKNLHAVCYSSFTNRQAAVEELERIRKVSDPSAWILYY